MHPDLEITDNPYREIATGIDNAIIVSITGLLRFYISRMILLSYQGLPGSTRSMPGKPR